MIGLLLALLAAPPQHPWLPGDEPLPASIGTPQTGHLIRGVRLPRAHPALQQLPTQAARGLDWGTDVTIRTLVRAAEAVAQEFPGSVTRLGNLSRQGGGDIPWSSSHNSGRDADIAFHLLDPEGQPDWRADLVILDDTGWAVDAQGVVRFDAARNWVLVRSLLTDPKSTPQYLFVSAPLRAQLLAEAERTSAPRDVIAQARRTLRQPRGKPAHNDHLHLRIHCTRKDLEQGCRDARPLRAGAPMPAKVRPDRRALALGLLLSPVADIRRRAVGLLGLLGESDTTSRVSDMLADPDSAVRVGAAQALVDLRASQKADALAAALVAETSAEASFSLAWALVELAPEQAGDPLVAMLGRSGTLTTGAGLRGEIAGLLADARASRATPRIIDLLVDPQLDVRQAARVALTRLTNTDRGDAMEPWMRWWRQHGGRTRERWLAQGFRAAGYAVADDAGKEAGVVLAEAVGDEVDYLSENARRLLMSLYGWQDRNNLMWGREDAAWFWGMKTAP